MATKIYKYEIHPNIFTGLPRGAKVLHVGEQRGKLCVWAIVDPNESVRDVRIVVIGTGFDASEAEGMTHVGTALMAGGDLVLHVFADGQEAKPAAHPAPTDWRQACHVEQAKDGRWDVWMPDRKHYLCDPDHPWWSPVSEYTDVDVGCFATESDARAALSIAPPPPGVGK